MQGFENGRGGFRGGPPGRGFRGGPGNQGFGQRFGGIDGPQFGNRGGPRFGPRGFGPRGSVPDGPGPQFGQNGPGPRFGGIAPNTGFGPRFGAINEANGPPGLPWEDESPGFGSGSHGSRASSGRRSMGFGEGDEHEDRRNDRSRSRSRTKERDGKSGFGRGNASRFDSNSRGNRGRGFERNAGTGSNNEPLVPRKPGTGSFKSSPEVTIDLTPFRRDKITPEPSKLAIEPLTQAPFFNRQSLEPPIQAQNMIRKVPEPVKQTLPFGGTGPGASKHLVPEPPTPKFVGPPKPLFGENSKPLFGETPKPLFGEPARPLFGEPARPLFGEPTRPLFGETPKPLFGEPSRNQDFGPPRQQAPGPPRRQPMPDLPLQVDNSIRQRVEEAVTPLCKMPIPIQLKKKVTLTREVLDAMRLQITEANPATNTWFLYQENKFQCILDLKNIVPSPITDGYRNKCEFIIGLNPADNNQLTIGFLVERGTSLVGPIDHLKHVPDRMKFIVFELQRCLRDSCIPPFDLYTGNGHWMGLTIRINGQGQALLVISFHPQNMSRLQVKGIKDNLAGFFAEGPGVNCEISSLYFNERQQWESGEFEHLFGDLCITETLLGKRFQISPKCFFSVNTPAAEKISETIADMVHLNRSCTLLDVCCGTGSIGLSLADRCGQVVGIDILEAAIEDARQNAMANDITNCEYFPGSVEEHLMNLFKRIAFAEVICVLDPPRGGLGPKAINHIRRNEAITKLVFVSSDPLSAMKCFVDLTRPPSNTFKGEPFIPVRAVPIDTFPHTNNFCVVFLFLRVTMADIVNPQNVNPDSYKPGCIKPGVSSYPEPTYGQGAAAPNLNWQQVSAPTVDGSVASTEEAGLSKDQVAWLNQMTQVYGDQFERNNWIETFRQQNMEASLAAVAAAKAAQAPPQPAAVAAGSSSETDAWAEYSKQYREYKEWWDKYGSTYNAANPQQAAQAPGASGTNPDAWQMYNQMSAPHYPGYNAQQPPLPSYPPPN